MKTKTFPARVLLTVTTGRLLTKGKNGGNGIGDLYDILGWMTDDSPMTHLLGRFGEECKPWLLKWFPELEAAGSVQNIAKLDTLLEDCKARKEPLENAIAMWLEWVEEPATAGIKKTYDVGRIPQEEHATKNHIEELIEMRGGKSEGILVVEV